MTESDYDPVFTSPTIDTTSSQTENNENQKPTQSNKDKMREMLLKRGKLRPLNISKPRNGEIVLETIEIKKDENVIDEAATKWLIDKVGLKETVLMSKSPKASVKKRIISKQRALKNELQEKLKIRRKDEQEERYDVYNADNEIVNYEDEEEEMNDDVFELSDAEEKKKVVNETKKPKIVVNEDEEIVDEEEEDDDNEVDDEEEPFSDDECEDDEGEEEKKKRNAFVDDEASLSGDDVGDDSDEDFEEESKSSKPIKKSQPSRLLISDDDDEEEDEKEVEIEEKSTTLVEESEASFEKPAIPTQSTLTPENKSQFSLPNCLTQRLDPYTGQKAPIEPDPSQRSICLDTQTDKDELMLLCSGSFGTQKSDQTLCSKFEKYDVMDFLSDSSPIPESQVPETQSQDLQKVNSVEELPSNDIAETQRRIEAIYNDFNNAEDSMDSIASFSDSDVETTVRKRKNIVYSDEEEEELQQSQPKQRRILDFDDSDINESLDVSHFSSSSKPAKLVAMDFDDVFTTEDTSNNPGILEEIQDRYEEEHDSDDDGDGEKYIDDYGSENEDDEIGEGPPDKMLRKFVDDEASLSGDDVGDDPDEENDFDALDTYELDEADKEEYDAEEVRNELSKHHMKYVINEDEKQLYRLQQKYFVDGDLHGANMDRSFRYRMNKEITDEDWAKMVKLNPVLAKADSDEEEDDEDIALTKKKSFDLKKWRAEKTTNDNEKVDDLTDDFDSPLFSLGKLATMNKPMSKMSKKTTSTIVRSSFLNNRDSLGVLLKETVTETKMINTLFTAMKKP